MRKRMIHTIFAMSAIAIVAVFAKPSVAQEAVIESPSDVMIEVPQAAPEAAQDVVEVAPAFTGVNPNDIPSVVFTFWEHTAIRDARRARGQGGAVRGVDEAELNRELRRKQDELRVKPPAEERDITLGGIVYRRSNDWTIWLNGQRITPEALPEEIIDLKVYSDYIELKWFDEWSNQIFPIRMRAHQRFNIDTRIFLPG